MGIYNEFWDEYNEFWDEYNEFRSDVFNEAVGAPEKSFVQKIFGAIKKFFQWIIKLIKKIISKIASLFTRKSSGKTVAEIYDDVIHERVVRKVATDPAAVKAPTAAPKNIIAKKEIKTDDGKVLSIPYLVTNLRMKIDSKNRSLTITDVVNAGIARQHSEVGKLSAWDNQIGAGLRDFKILHLFFNSNNRNELKSNLEKVVAILNDKTKVSKLDPNDANVVKNSKKFLEQATAFRMYGPPSGVKATYKEIQDIESFFSEIADGFQKIYEYILTAPTVDQEILLWAKEFSRLLEGCQYAMNLLYQLLNGRDLLDASALNSMDTPEQVATFISAMIDNKIPGTFVVNSAALAVSPKLSDTVNPPHGQFRFVLKKTDGSGIFKCAMSKLAIIQNRQDIIISNKLKTYPDIYKLIVPVTKTYGEGIMNELPFCNIGGTDEEARALKDRINYLAARIGIEFVDIYHANIGKLKGENTLRLTDYNWRRIE